MKETLFIGHASQDNLFAVWLRSKLELLGYTAFCDVEDLGSGSFWNELDRVLTEESIKFLPIITQDYIDKSKEVGSGVERELSRVMVLLRKNPKLIIPIRLDKTSWDDLSISTVGLQGVDFSYNWAEGLKQLIKILDKDDIKPNKVDPNKLNLVENLHKALGVNSSVLNKEERYYCNWFPVELPESLFIYDRKFKFGEVKKDFPYPHKKEKNLIITFCSPPSVENYFDYESRLQLNTAKALEENSIEFDNERKIVNLNKKVIEILNKAFRSYILDNGGKIYRLSGNKETYYFLDEKPVSLKHLGKNYRSLITHNKKINIHFAIEHNAILYPFPAYFINYHLVFTYLEFSNKITNKKKVHSLRRSIPTNWYNRHWFEKLLASTIYLSNDIDKKKILVPIGDEEKLIINAVPLELTSPIGYIEPSKGSKKKVE